MQSLLLVRGNDSQGENQDLFVVAEGKTDEDRGKMAVQIWNNWCVNMEWEREDGDEFDITDTVQPENIRVIIPDVQGTIYAGLNRGVDWATLSILA